MLNYLYRVTLTLHVTAFPSTLTVIIVEPAFKAVIKPSGVTVAMDGDCEVYMMPVPVASDGVKTGLSW